MSQANGGAIGGMAARFGLVEQGGGGSPESFPIGPQAMAGQLLREEAPDARQQIAVWGVGWQPEGPQAALLGRPPGAPGRGALVAAVVEHQHQILLGPRLGDLLQKGGEARPILGRGRRPHQTPRGVVQRPRDGDPLVGPGGGYPHRMPPPLPGLCQVGVGRQVTFIPVNTPQSRPGSCPLFCSSPSTC